TAREQVHELYQQLVDQLASKFDYPRVQLLTYNPAANSLKVVTAAGRDGHVPQTQAAVVPIGRGTIGKAGETNTAIAADAPNIHYNDYPDLISPTIQSEYALPIATDQDLIGVLNIQSETPNQFDQDTKLFLETLTTQTALIIQTIKFKNEMRDQLDELSVLQRMASTEGWKTFDSTTTLSASRYIYDQNLQATIPVEDQKELSTNASLVKPLEIRGQTIGALGITTDQTQNLTREEKMLLESVSSEVAEALERARLFETSQRSAAELAVLNEMGNSFTQAQNEEAITDHIYTYTAKLMETPQFYVAFYNYDEEEITFPYVVMDGTRVTPEHPYYDQWLPKPVGTGLTGFIIKNQQPILIDDKVEETLEELGLPFRQFGGQTHSWLGVPMIIGNRVLGVISVQSEDTPNLYNQHHLNLLTTIASQAAVSINNTRLFQQEQERAEQERLVRTITDKVRRGTDTASILQVALQELSTILNADVSTIQLGTKDQLLSKQQSPENNQTTNLNGEQ
ncbi:MAG TPA: GAF domain-containing protein, partial [Anaerolineales bacterium]|nr:GAF domain-containing protein [Anaerolineales bacterium]